MEFLQCRLASTIEGWRQRPLFNTVLLTAALSSIFILMPVIDIAASRLFYVEGQGFPARSVEVLRTTRAIGQYFPVTFAIVIVIAVILKLIYPSRPCLFPARFTAYFASLFLLGPGLLVNGILKPLWDRPRPVNTVDFGGRDSFLPAWAMGGDFFAHRSFVSGETAGVVCLLPLALFVLPQWRRSIFTLLAAFAVVISLNRIAFGAHYLSDVLVSAGLTATMAIGLWYAICSQTRSKLSDAAIEAMLTQAGLGIRRVGRQQISAGAAALQNARRGLALSPAGREAKS